MSKDYFGEKLIFIEKSYKSEFFSDFEQKNFGRVVKTAFDVSKGSFWAKIKKIISFLDFEREIVRL